VVTARVTSWMTLAALALLGAGCGSDPATGLVVVVDADPLLAQRLGSIRVQTFAATGLVPIDEQVFAVGLRSRFPISFGVAPRPGSTQVRVEVTGIESARPIVFARVATRYVAGRVLTLPITLWGACADQLACPSPGMTCGPAGPCGANAAVDPAALTDYTPSATTPCPSGMVRDNGRCVPVPDVLTIDAPTADVGADAGPADVPSTDAGPADAPSTDASTMDASVDVIATDVITADIPPDVRPDVPPIDAPDVPPIDAPDVPDVGAPDAPVDVPAPDLGAAPDVVDAGASDVVPDCATGLVRCGDVCVDLNSSGGHCGACGRTCGTGDLCLTGQCGLTVVSLAAGLRHTCAVLHNGNTRCWGGSLTNDLANNDPRMFSTPQFAAAPVGAREVGAGAGLGCVRYGSSNRVMCWGDNDVGAVGAGVIGGGPREATTNVSLSEGGTLVDVTALALHAAHVCALAGAVGNVRCWGANGRGQLGDGTTTHRSAAVLASTAASTPLADVTDVAVSVTASYALTRAGEVYAWGGNVSRELGVASVTGNARSFAAAVPGLPSARRVFAGGANACIISATTNLLYCWGANDTQQLGAGTGPQLPRQIDVGGTVTDVAVGQGFLCAVRSDRSVHCLGANRYGQLGAEPRVDRPAVVAVGTIRDALAITAGTDHACALREGNVVTCWGSDRLGQTGSGRTLFRAAPALTPTFTGGASAIAAMEGGTCARRTDGSVVCWGANARGELGDGTILSRGVAQPVLNEAGGGLLAVRELVGGAASACARVPGTGSGLMACWGANDEGTLGVGTFADERYPEAITALPGVASMGLRYATACAVQDNGALSCWGRNTSGQGGSGASGAAYHTPRTVYPDGFAAAAPGLTHTCARRTDGAVVCFGSGDRGELGDGTLARRDAPVSPTSTAVQVGSANPVGGGRMVHAFASVASGARFSCGVTAGGAGVRCWGANNLSQLGRGSSDTGPHSDASPVEGLPAATIDAVTVGSNHACALAGQQVYCWGDNAFGATGRAVMTPSTPTLRAAQVPGLGRAVVVAAGSFHTCAINPDEGVYCWGLNADNQLGSDVPMYRSTPVDVAGVR